jgi:hypothetical protein
MAQTGSTTSSSFTTGSIDMDPARPAAPTVSEIIEASRYLVLATADATGRPWSSPLYFAHIDFTEFFWVSSPDVTHSRNIAARPEVAIVVFDSQAEIGVGQGVYMPAVAKLVEGSETAPGIEAFSRRSVAHGGPEWTSERVQPGAALRLYQATADSHWILAKDGRPDHRIPVQLT